MLRKQLVYVGGEERYQAIAMTEVGILMVVYTIRNNSGVVRLISARKANKREKRAYDLGFLKPYKEP
ncbi:BrnT family toxin [Thalassomonas haliotis]